MSRLRFGEARFVHFIFYSTPFLFGYRLILNVGMEGFQPSAKIYSKTGERTTVVPIGQDVMIPLRLTGEGVSPYQLCTLILYREEADEIFGDV